MLRFARVGSLGLLAVLALFAVAGCATSDRGPIDPLPPRPLESDLGDWRIQIAPEAMLFASSRVSAENARPDLLIHFHGWFPSVQREFVASGRGDVLLVVNFSGLSAAYEKPMSEPRRFERLVTAALEALTLRARVPDDASWNRISLTSFSAGYGAIRAILRDPAWAKRISGIGLADSLYAGYLDGDPPRRVNAANIDVFIDFARRATRGETAFFYSHCYLEPGKYAGTHETANELIRAVSLTRRESDFRLPDAATGTLHVTSIVEQGRLRIYGCEGKTGDDHGQHLRHLRVVFSNLAALGS